MLVTVALLAVCTSSDGRQAGRVGEGADLDGYWRSDGYGMLVEFRGAELRLLQTTEISCTRVAVAGRSAQTPSGAVAAFTVDEERSSQVLDVDSGLLTISAGRSPDAMRLRVDGAISDIMLRRAPTAPQVCTEPDADTALTNFDIFWQTFREHYPFFALHGVDWDVVRERFRPRITETTTPKQLHALFVEMIRPLHDAHTFVDLDSEDLEFSGERPDPQPLTGSDRERVSDIVDDRLDDRLVGPRRSFADGKISFGRLPHGVGYLEIASFADYTDSNRTSEGLAELDHALDFALGTPMTGLVIDVRLNDGGSDVFGVALASRLASTPYTAYVKTARNDPIDPSRFTTGQPITVEPSTDAIYTGPIALLTSRYSISAAETFAQALLGRPQVTRVGENTQGVFSDVLIRTLPNGTLFGLSNEVYTTDGMAFEKVGLAPDLPTGLVFQRSNLDADRDPELDAAIRALSR